MVISTPILLEAQGEENFEPQKLFNFEETSIKFENNRFESFYNEGLKYFENEEYEKSISKLEILIDKTFVYDCRGLDLLAKNYEKLGESKNQDIYTEISKLCSLIRAGEKQPISQQALIVESLQKNHPVNPHLKIYLNYLKYRLGQDNLIQDDALKDSITYNLVNAWYETGGDNFKNHDIQKYSSLLNELDYLYKPSLLGSLGVKYQDTALVEKSLIYEELSLPRSKFGTTHHNAYHYLASVEGDETKSLYYYLKSLSYDSSYYNEYSSKIKGLIFNTKIFEKKDFSSYFSKYLEEQDYGFFIKLQKISAVDTQDYSIVNEILEEYHSLGAGGKLDVDVKILVEYMYGNITEKHGKEKVCDILNASLANEAKFLFTLFIEDTKECLDIDNEKLDIDIEKYNHLSGTDLNPSSNNVSKHNNFLYIISIIISIIILSFFVYVFLKKK